MSTFAELIVALNHEIFLDRQALTEVWVVLVVGALTLYCDSDKEFNCLVSSNGRTRK